MRPANETARVSVRVDGDVAVASGYGDRLAARVARAARVDHTIQRIDVDVRPAEGARDGEPVEAVVAAHRRGETVRVAEVGKDARNAATKVVRTLTRTLRRRKERRVARGRRGGRE